MKFPEQFRWANPPNPQYATSTGTPFGMFLVKSWQSPSGNALKILAVDGEDTGWEHVSVSLPDRPRKCPSWEEMCFVKDLFWEGDACVAQYHPPKDDYVNNANVLHLWRYVVGFPMPPKEFV